MQVKDLPINPKPGVCLVPTCPECVTYRPTFSATRGDYFQLPIREELTCEHGWALVLVERRVSFVRIPRAKAEESRQ